MSKHPHFDCESCRASYVFTQALMLVCLIVGLVSGGTRGIAAAIMFAAMEISVVLLRAVAKDSAAADGRIESGG